MTQGQITQNSKIPTRDERLVFTMLGLVLPFLPFLEAVVPDGHLGRPDNVVVGEHHALGVASGATGVDQGGTLVDGDAPEPGLKCSVIQTVSSVENVLRKFLFLV